MNWKTGDSVRVSTVARNILPQKLLAAIVESSPQYCGAVAEDSDGVKADVVFGPSLRVTLPAELLEFSADTPPADPKVHFSLPPGCVVTLDGAPVPLATAIGMLPDSKRRELEASLRHTLPVAVQTIGICPSDGVNEPCEGPEIRLHEPAVATPVQAEQQDTHAPSLEQWAGLNTQMAQMLNQIRTPTPPLQMQFAMNILAQFNNAQTSRLAALNPPPSPLAPSDPVFTSRERPENPLAGLLSHEERQLYGVALRELGTYLATKPEAPKLTT